MRVVIPSVNYADFLDFILPYWLPLVPPGSITVVTSLDDSATQNIATKHGVTCLPTGIWYEQLPVQNSKEGPVIFNKAAALDLAFGFAGDQTSPPRIGERCLSLDCDVIPFGKIKPEWDLLPDTLYGCPRYQCENMEALQQYMAGDGPGLPLIMPRLRGDKTGRYAISGRERPQKTAEACLGYFQLFRYNPKIKFGSFRSAGGYDVEFKHQFVRKMCLPGIHVLHLGEQNRANWKGRIVRQWLG